MREIMALTLATCCLLAVIPSSWGMQGLPASPPSSSPVVVDLQDLDTESDSDTESMPEPESELGFVQGLGIEGPPPEKRAYTYVSEYKRLPIYNFGLGKRWSGGSSFVNNDDKRARLYSFGLGKRTRPYSFGLGKRGGDQQDSLRSYLEMMLPYKGQGFGQASHRDLSDDVDDDGTSSLQDDLFEKRSRQYSFGLGKRPAGGSGREFGQRFNFGIGKRPMNEEFGHRYQFGLGKRRFQELEEEHRGDPRDTGDESSASS